MGLQKKVRKFGQMKRIIKARDSRIKGNAAAPPPKKDEPVSIPQAPSGMFFQANTNLAPPYSVIVDTNFIVLSVKGKIDLLDGLMNLLYASCTPVILGCVLAELEKLGSRYAIARRIAKDERWRRIPCSHKGTYADDCIVRTVTQHRIYLIGTNDRDLKRRLRRIPGVPIVSVARGKYVIERLPETVG